MKYALYNKPAFWSVLTTAITATNQAALTILIVRLGNVQLLGQHSLALALTAPPILLGMMQLRLIQTTCQNTCYLLRAFVTQRAMMLSTVSLPIILLSSISCWSQTSTAITILMVGLLKVLDGIEDTLLGHLQRHGQWKALCAQSCCKSIAVTFGITLALVTTRSLNAGLALGVVVQVVCLAITARVASTCTLPLECYSKDVLKLASSRLGIWSLTRRGLPLGFFALLMSLQSSYPRYVLQSTHGLDALGHLTAVSYLPMAVNLVSAAIASADAVTLGQACASQETGKYIQTVLNTILICTIPPVLMTFGAIFYGGTYLTLAYGPEFGSLTWVLVLLSSIGIIHSVTSVLNITTVSHGGQRYQLVLSVTSFALIALASHRLISAFGLSGVLCFTAMVSCSQLFVAAYLSLPPSKWNTTTKSVQLERLAA